MRWLNVRRVIRAGDGNATLKVYLEQETVWLNQEQMAELF